MTTQEFINAFIDEMNTMCETVKAKNHDYAGGSDPFYNFKMVEQLGITSVERGILTRMTDKLSRAITLIDKEPEVKGEQITDTLRDLSVYSTILLLYIKSKQC